MRDVRVFVNHGKGMPNGEPVPLKSRRQMRYDDAVATWTPLLRNGCSVAKPVWRGVIAAGGVAVASSLRSRLLSSTWGLGNRDELPEGCSGKALECRLCSVR